MDGNQQLERFRSLRKMSYRKALDELLTGDFQTFGYFANQLEELEYFPNLSGEKILEKVKNHFGVPTGNPKNKVIRRGYEILEKVRNYFSVLTGNRKRKTRVIEVRGEYVRDGHVSIIEKL